MKALLLSGGIDSAALAYWKRPEILFTIDYGQAVAQAEINSARQIAQATGINHEVLTVRTVPVLGTGSLAKKPSLNFASSPEWWPYRNQWLITIAAMRGISIGVDDILVGSVASDKIHRDGTLVFYEHISGLLTCQEGNIRVSAPAIDLPSEELIRESKIPLSILGWTFSCHISCDPCGACRGCTKHLDVFEYAESLYAGSQSGGD